MTARIFLSHLGLARHLIHRIKKSEPSSIAHRLSNVSQFELSFLKHEPYRRPGRRGRLPACGLGTIDNYENIIIVFISGFIIEIIGVYIESKFIDPYVTKINCIDNKRFDFLWNKYLLINRKKTNDLILVDYYRSILTKMKFLINLPVALNCSYAIIIFSQFVLKIEFFYLQTLDGFKGFVLLGFIVITISWFSYKRAKYCAKILFESRKNLMLNAL
mgnify:CR=1 FL=1